MKNILLIVLLVMTSSCLTEQQRLEYREMKASGYEVVEKNTTAAAWLGVLPGGGSFYTGRVGLGILDLLLWPYSICWDPAIGHNAAEKRNYWATSDNVRMKKKREIAKIYELKLEGKLTSDEYENKRILIERKYTFGLKE